MDFNYGMKNPFVPLSAKNTNLRKKYANKKIK